MTHIGPLYSTLPHHEAVAECDEQIETLFMGKRYGYTYSCPRFARA